MCLQNQTVRAWESLPPPALDLEPLQQENTSDGKASVIGSAPLGIRDLNLGLRGHAKLTLACPAHSLPSINTFTLVSLLSTLLDGCSRFWFETRVFMKVCSLFHAFMNLQLIVRPSLAGWSGETLLLLRRRAVHTYGSTVVVLPAGAAINFHV